MCVSCVISRPEQNRFSHSRLFRAVFQNWYPIVYMAGGDRVTDLQLKWWIVCHIILRKRWTTAFSNMKYVIYTLCILCAEVKRKRWFFTVAGKIETISRTKSTQSPNDLLTFRPGKQEKNSLNRINALFCFYHRPWEKPRPHSYTTNF